MTSNDSPAVLGRYQRAARAPRGLRRVMKLGEIDRAIQAVDEWRAIDAQIRAQRTALVRDIRSRGGSWDSVGWLLGTTGRAAQQRFGGAEREKSG